jgi:TusA-related sulfurtransferase
LYIWELIYYDMKIVDTRGQSCPAPLIATKRLLKETVKGEAFQVLIGSQNALNNISSFLKDNKAGFSVKESEGFWTMTVSITGEGR